MREFVGTLRRRSRFTLIEMLVVVAIVAILASLMSPSLMSTLDASRRVACQNNLRQQYLGFSAYAGDEHGRLPHSPKFNPSFPVFFDVPEVPDERGFSYFAKGYLGIALKTRGYSTGRAGGAGARDVLYCPGVAQHMPEYDDMHGTIEYSFYASLPKQKRGVRLSRVSGSNPYPRMLSCDRLFTGQLNGNDQGARQTRMQVGHRSQGGNVLAGDGSVKWEEAFGAFDMFWSEFGEKLTLPVLKYVVAVPVAWALDKDEYRLYRPEPGSKRGWELEHNTERCRDFY